MKHTYALFIAAAAAVASMIRFALPNQPGRARDPETASDIPRITPLLVEQYAYAGASDADIADRFLMDESEIRRDYAEVLRVARALMRINLRMQQHELAKKHNVSMLTWLGRNLLGQSSNPIKPGEPEPDFEADPPGSG